MLRARYHRVSPSPVAEPVSSSGVGFEMSVTLPVAGGAASGASTSTMAALFSCSTVIA